MSLVRRTNIFDPFSLDLWDPLEGFPLFGITGAVSQQPSSGGGTCAPGETGPNMVNIRVDWKETPEAHVLKIDLPGVWKQDVKIEVEDGRVLKIEGERCREKEEKEGTWHRVERGVGKFFRRFRLPENAKMEEVMAVMENGVLTITVPKQEMKKPEVKNIEIAG